MQKAKSKTLRRSSLTAVPGIGAAKANALMSHFGTLSKLRASSLEEISAVSGISEKNAEAVYAFLHGEENG